jgi:hypothetical protein
MLPPELRSLTLSLGAGKEKRRIGIGPKRAAAPYRHKLANYYQVYLWHCTLYAPPNYCNSVVHATKADARQTKSTSAARRTE